MDVLRLLALVVGLALFDTQAIAADKDALRPEVGRPLQEAQKLIRAKQYKDALRPIGEAEAVADLTPYEQFVTAQMRGAAAAGAGDADAAAEAYEKVLEARRLPGDEQLRITEAVAGTYLRAKNYPKAISWIQTYRDDGGTNADILNFLPQAYYLSGNYKKAAEETTRLVTQAENARTRPREDQLKLLASSQQKQNDMAGYTQTLEKLVRYYPSPAYWADVIQRTAARPGFSRNLDLDRYRLLRATSNLTEARDYSEAAQLAIQAGLPGEAKRYVDEAYAKRIFGSGDASQTERQTRLKALVDKKYAEDKTSIATTDAEAAAADSGDPLVKTGLAYITYGDAAKGLPMMEQGIRKGSLRYPDQSRLQLGYGYYLAGQKEHARTVLAAVSGTDGAADLARLWAIIAE
ncbi:MAG: tetratricopeptide repeat protein [Panacagrimonas sp.]